MGYNMTHTGGGRALHQLLPLFPDFLPFDPAPATPTALLSPQPPFHCRASIVPFSHRLPAAAPPCVCVGSVLSPQCVAGACVDYGGLVFLCVLSILPWGGLRS